MSEISPKISIQGYLGSFHHLAGLAYFQSKLKDDNLLQRDTFQAVFDDVTTGQAAYGIVAIYNTIAGKIPESNHLLTQTSQVVAVDQVTMPIQQNLIGIKGAIVQNITSIFSHPIALQQCRQFFARLSQIKLIETPDTALSVENIMAKQDPTQAAIASALAAEIYGATILARNIQDDSNNATTFAIIKCR